MTNHDVIIIGAGIAGLTCANDLRKEGFEPLVVEASDAVGGRIRTDIVDGFRLDRGFQILLTAYPEAQRLLHYEALHLNNFQSGAMIRIGEEFQILGNPFKAPSQLFKTLFSSVGTWGDKLKVLRLAREVSNHSTDSFFSEASTDTLTYLQDYGWSEEMIDTFFKPFFGGVFLENDLTTSSQFFKFVFKQFYSGDAALPAEGIQAIPEQIAQRLPSESLMLHTKAVKIEGHEVTLSNGQVMQAEHIVVATDARQADLLLCRNQKREYNITTCSYFAADRSPLKHKMLVLNPNRLSVVHNLCVPSDIAPSYAPSGKSLISISTQGLELFDEQKLTAHIIQELGAWFGEEVNQWQHLRTYHIPEALLHFPAEASSSDLRLAKGLYECGDHTAYPSLNAAMATGRKVAEMIAESV
ncbi:MAG: NAD(P)/FAD-dependent oxidoreductase [Runella sp.]